MFFKLARLISWEAERCKCIHRIVGKAASLCDAGERPSGKVNWGQTWQEMGGEACMQTQGIRTSRQEKPLVTSEKGNADERGNVLVRGQA